MPIQGKVTGNASLPAISVNTGVRQYDAKLLSSRNSRISLSFILTTPPSAISLDEWIFNMQAHPLKIVPRCAPGQQKPIVRARKEGRFITRPKKIKKIEVDDHSQRAVTTALWCNFLVFSLKFGVWIATSSHVMLAEVVHSPPRNIFYAALVIGGSFIIEGASLAVAVDAVRKGAAAEGMTIRDYVWRGHDPTALAVMTEDGAAVTGLAIATASLVAVKLTGNPIYDPIGSIIVGNLLGVVAIFLIQRNRHALIGRAIDDNDMKRVLEFLKNDPVVDSVYDCKSEMIGPGFFRFKAEIDFNGVILVQNYLSRTGPEDWAKDMSVGTSWNI
ncbi:hypothetical protein CTI12_AA252160 [Artemisia annua]|uniref:Metal tolerance protein C4 n=1 Tax=Artemisia annua TaxID=35608 RepID=A0A2U1NLG5_ARTAN|nr:hypothetical protein CTI12_AA252160 [Artemisia annua]